MDDVIALGQDRIFVPFGNIHVHGVMLRSAPLNPRRIRDNALPVLCDNSASALLVQHRAIWSIRVNVALVAADRPLAILALLAAVLNTCVVAALFDCCLQFEVPEHAATPNQKLIVGQLPRGRGGTDYFAVLHLPQIRIAIPSLEIFAVEKSFEIRVLCKHELGEEQRKKKAGKRFHRGVGG